MNATKIFIVNNAGHNFENAFDYTDLPRKKAEVNMTEGCQDIFDTDRLIYTIKERLEDSLRGDYILLSGSSVLNVIAVVIQLQKFREANLLIYHVKERRYVLRTITLEKMEESYGKSS